MRLTVMLVVAVLVACSGPSTRDGTRVADPSPTEMVVVPATATGIAPDAPTATPTSPAATRTATRAPEATPTPRPSPTPTAVPDPSAVESALLAMLPAGDSLPAGWSLVSSGPVRGRSGGTLLCGVDPFPGASEKMAEVEAEYQRDDPTAAASVLQDVVSFPEPVAIEAMAWARQTITCREWTDEDGTAVTLAPFEDAGIGDESLATTFTVTSGGGDRVDGRWFLVRRGGLIATIAYLGSDATTPGVSEAVTAAAVQLLDPERVAAATIDPAVQSTLLGLLLRAGDIGQDWMKTASGPTPSGSQSAICGVGPFAESDGKLGDITARFEDGSSGMAVEQRIVAYPAASVQSVMDAARAAMSCGEWVDPSGSAYFLDAPEPVDLSADGAMTTFTVDGPDGGYGALYVVRVGAIVTSITFRSPDPLAPENVMAVVRRAIELIQAAT